MSEARQPLPRFFGDVVGVEGCAALVEGVVCMGVPGSRAAACACMRAVRAVFLLCQLYWCWGVSIEGAVRDIVSC